jgi:hypothetical protein
MISDILYSKYRHTCHNLKLKTNTMPTQTIFSMPCPHCRSQNHHYAVCPARRPPPKIVYVPSNGYQQAVVGGVVGGVVQSVCVVV